VRQSIAAGANRIRVMAGDRPIETRLEVSERQRAILLAGGILNYARKGIAAAS